MPKLSENLFVKKSSISEPITRWNDFKILPDDEGVTKAHSV